jgi:hypothetical protein
MMLHADPVAENRPAAEGTAWIHRQNGNAAVLFAQSANKLVDQCALACSRLSGDSDCASSTSVRCELLQKLLVSGVAILEDGCGPRDYPRITRENAVYCRDAASSFSTAAYRRAT